MEFAQAACATRDPMLYALGGYDLIGSLLLSDDVSESKLEACGHREYSKGGVH